MKNPELVKAFRAAKRRIAGNTDRYICHALQHAFNCHTIGFSAMDAARTLVNERLNNQHTLEAWLYFEHDVAFDTTDATYRAKIRTTRIAWLNSLIKEFS